MNKEEMLKAYNKTKKEWENLKPKQKAKKLIDHINNLLEDKEKDEETRQNLLKELVILEEVDSEEIEDYLNKLNEIVMNNCMENIEKNY